MVDHDTLNRSFVASVDRLVADGRAERLAYFLSTHPLSRDEENPQNGLLNHALESGNEALARVCLEIGATVDRDDDIFPPLYYALERADGDLSMLDFLIERDVNPNIRLLNDYTPLHTCVINDQSMAALRLLGAGADPNAVTRIDDYYTPLMEASSRGRIQIFKLLLNAGANPDFVNRLGESAISVVAKRSRDRIEASVSEFKRHRHLQ